MHAYIHTTRLRDQVDELRAKGGIPAVLAAQDKAAQYCTYFHVCMYV